MNGSRSGYGGTPRGRLKALHCPARPAFDQTGEHAGDLFQVVPEFGGDRISNEPTTTGDLDQRHALLDGTAGDGEEGFPVGFREAAIALGKARRYGDCCPVELFGQEVVTAREACRKFGNLICEIDRLLIDGQTLENERQGRLRLEQ